MGISLRGLVSATLYLLLAGVMQDTVAAAPATEPPDAGQVRAQIVRVEHMLPSIPDRGAALYFFATTRQHLGEASEAMKLLRECLAMGEGFDPIGSPAFGQLQGSKHFDDLVRQVHRAFPVVRGAKVAFLTPEKDLIPEGLAYDPLRKVFYLSSLHKRKIVKISMAGEVSDFVPAGRDNLMPVLGIRFDPSDGTIWAASWSETSNTSELLHFEGSGQLLGRYAPNGTPHGFNDLAITHNGELFVTDTVGNQVYRFDRAAHAFVSLSVFRSLSEPNGIALDAANRLLFVADDFGVIRVELSGGASREVDRGPGNTLAGIDGLYWHSGRLIAVQNGIGSPRIVSFRLSDDGAKVKKVTVLENRTHLTMLPTTGAINGGKFYFIANSQIDNMHGDDVADASKLEPVQIGVLELPSERVR
jgi:sugar lactone lactonase YvrE